MSAPDFQGPYDDFVERLADIKRLVCAIESLYRGPMVVSTKREGIDLASIGPKTSNNTNSMAIVFLASSFEEFVREEISGCASLMRSKYATLKDKARHSFRNRYWALTLERLGFMKSVLTKGGNRAPDATVLNKVRPLLDAAHRFVLGDDPSVIDPATTVHHGRNFRPHVVNEISSRLGISNLIRSTAAGPSVKSRLGVVSDDDAETLLIAKLDEFYDRRNETVHSLNSTSGYGVDTVLDWIMLFEAVAFSMKDVLAKEVATW